LLFKPPEVTLWAALSISETLSPKRFEKLAGDGESEIRQITD
jgi:hypothetical protein